MRGSSRPHLSAAPPGCRPPAALRPRATRRDRPSLAEHAASGGRRAGFLSRAYIARTLPMPDETDPEMAETIPPFDRYRTADSFTDGRINYAACFKG